MGFQHNPTSKRGLIRGEGLIKLLRYTQVDIPGGKYTN